MLAIYCRRSNKDKNKDSISITNQQDKGIELAKELGLKYDIFIDDHVSGTLDHKERDGLFEILKGVESGKFTHLFVWDNSRLERNAGDRMYNIIPTLRVYNVELYMYGGRYDYNDPQIALTGNIESVLNEHYVALTRKKVKAALYSKVSNGETRGIMPYGYKKAENSKQMIIDEEEAEVVKRIYKLSLEGTGTDHIAKILTREGIPTRYNKIKKGSITTTDKFTGKQTTTEKKNIKWAGNTVRGIILNPVYKGERKWNDETFPCPAIFSANYWQKVQNNLKANRTYSGQKVKHNYLLRGLLFCDNCGKRFAGRVNKSSGDNNYYCTSKRSTSCGMPSINRPKIENAIWGQLFFSGVIVKQLETEYNKDDNSIKLAHVRDQILLLGKEVQHIQAKRAKALELVIEGFATKDQLKETLNKIDGELNGVKNEIDKLEIEKMERENATEKVKEYKDIFEKLTDNAPFQDRERIVHDFIEKIVISVDEGGYYLVINYKIDITSIALRSNNLKDHEFFINRYKWTDGSFQSVP